jgi:hypothetical protein
MTWLPRHSLTASRDMAPSPSAHCLAVTWLPRHPPTAVAVGRVSTGGLPVGKLLRYPLGAVLSLRLPTETPRE